MIVVFPTSDCGISLYFPLWKITKRDNFDVILLEIVENSLLTVDSLDM